MQYETSSTKRESWQWPCGWRDSWCGSGNARPGRVSARSAANCPTNPAANFLIEEFLKSRNIPDRKAARELEGCMGALFKMRNEIAHPSDKVAREGDFRERDFKDAREKSQVMDSMLKQMELRAALPEWAKSWSVLPALRHGKRGRHRQHGVLAEFAEWWGDGELRFADPFGGRPWGGRQAGSSGAAVQTARLRLLRAQERTIPRRGTESGGKNITAAVASSSTPPGDRRKCLRRIPTSWPATTCARPACASLTTRLRAMIPRTDTPFWTLNLWTPKARSGLISS